MDLYGEVVLDHWHNPRNATPLKNPDFEVRVLNQLCGDEVKLQVRLQKLGQRGKVMVREVACVSNGCVISQAAGSILSEQIKGKKLDQLAALSWEDLVKLLGIRLLPARINCVLLPWRALTQLLKQLKNLKEGA